jgi:hypothetical protein
MARRIRRSLNGRLLVVDEDVVVDVAVGLDHDELGRALLGVLGVGRFQPVPATSSCPDCTAAIWVERSRITMNLMPSRYGRPFTK